MSSAFIKLILISSLGVCSLTAQDSGNYLNDAKQLYRNVAANLLQSAQLMPAEDYSFRPTPQSPTFAELISDVAVSQSDSCSAIEGKRSAPDGSFSRLKPDLVSALEAATVRCGSAYASVNSLNSQQEVGFGSDRHTKLGLLFMNASRCEEIYGRLEVYLRLKGIVPPSHQARILPVSNPRN